MCFEDFDDAPEKQPEPSAPPLSPGALQDGAPVPGSGAAGDRDGRAGPSGRDKGKGRAAAGDAELRTPLLPPLGLAHSGCDSSGQWLALTLTLTLTLVLEYSCACRCCRRWGWCTAAATAVGSG